LKIEQKVSAVERENIQAHSFAYYCELMQFCDNVMLGDTYKTA
jgi:hypothetical protein